MNYKPLWPDFPETDDEDEGGPSRFDNLPAINDDPETRWWDFYDSD